MSSKPNSDAAPEEPSLFKEDYLPPGEVKFGEYQILKCLSYGPFGALYHVQNFNDFNEILIEVLPKWVNTDQELYESFRQSAKKLTGLNHPNVLKADRFTLINGRACLLHPLFEGTPLSTYIENYQGHSGEETTTTTQTAPPVPTDESPNLHRDSTPFEGLPPEKVKDIVHQTMEGIRSAFFIDLYHFHLNLNNILISEEGEIKIYGFGIVQQLEKELKEKIFAQWAPPEEIPPSVYGGNTPNALSPEILKGMAGDQRSDTYSIGLNTHFLLTGRMEDNVEELTSPSKFSDEITTDWDNFIASCTSYNCDKRIETPTEVITTIEAILLAEDIPEEEEKAEGTIAKHLTKFPIPESIRENVEPQTVKKYQIAIIAVALVSAFAIIGFSIFDKSNETNNSSSNAQELVREVKKGETPALSISTNPGNVNLSIEGPTTGKFKSDNRGKISLQLPPGNYKITAEADYYAPKTLPKVTITDEPASIKLVLEPAWTNVTIKSNPGARLTAIRDDGNAVDLGIVPENGELAANKKITAGSYTLTAELEDFQTAKVENLTLIADTPEIKELKLTPKLGIIEFSSQPEGVSIAANGKVIGKTPFTMTDIPVNVPITFRASLKDHVIQEKEITLKPAETLNIGFDNFIKETGTIIPAITLDNKPPAPQELSELKFVINNKEQEPNKIISEITVGEYEVVVSHPNYFDINKTISVKKRDKVPLNINLKPRPAKLHVRLGKQKNFRLLINNQLQKPNSNGIFSLPPNKELNLQIHIRDYYPVKETMSLTPNESKNWKVAAIPLPAPNPGKEYRIPYIGCHLEWIKPGKFVMGSNSHEPARLPNEGPETPVLIKNGFWAGKYEITQREYSKLMKNNPSTFQGNKKENHPVETVSWNDANAFCKKLTEQERRANRLPQNYVYRLPTEAEFEYFARAGSESPFSFGDEASPNDGKFVGTYPRASLSDDTRGPADKHYGTSPVGTFSANPWGIYDVHGNVKEWCYDFYSSRLPGKPKENWAGPESGVRHTYRSGGWDEPAHRCRSASREGLKPESESSSLGFRIILAKPINH